MRAPCRRCCRRNPVKSLDYCMTPCYEFYTSVRRSFIIMSRSTALVCAFILALLPAVAPAVSAPESFAPW